MGGSCAEAAGRRACGPHAAPPPARRFFSLFLSVQGWGAAESWRKSGVCGPGCRPLVVGGPFSAGPAFTPPRGRSLGRQSAPGTRGVCCAPRAGRVEDSGTRRLRAAGGDVALPLVVGFYICPGYFELSRWHGGSSCSVTREEQGTRPRSEAGGRGDTLAGRDGSARATLLCWLMKPRARAGPAEGLPRGPPSACGQRSCQDRLEVGP